MIVAVGSANRVKVDAVSQGLQGEKITLISHPAASLVRDQPMSDEETLQGAINRAKECLNRTQAAVAFGLEGGIVFMNNQVYLCHWGALADRRDNLLFSNSPLLRLPDDYRQGLLDGQNLDQMMAHFTGIANLGSKEGAIGYFTQNRLTRSQVLAQTVKILFGQYCHHYPLETGSA